MASSEPSDPSDSRTNSLNTSSSQNDDSASCMEVKGWLYKRTKMSRKWKKQYFLLKNSNLLYGDTPEVKSYCKISFQTDLINSILVKTAFQAYSTKNSVAQIFILYTTNDCFGITAG